MLVRAARLLAAALGSKWKAAPSWVPFHSEPQQTTQYLQWTTTDCLHHCNLLGTWVGRCSRQPHKTRLAPARCQLQRRTTPATARPACPCPSTRKDGSTHWRYLQPHCRYIDFNLHLLLVACLPSPEFLFLFARFDSLALFGVQMFCFLFPPLFSFVPSIFLGFLKVIVVRPLSPQTWSPAFIHQTRTGSTKQSSFQL